jgi:enoyl-CoA hydratase
MSESMSERSAASVGCDRSGAVAVVSFNRPEARNAIDRATRREFAAILASLDADDDVRAIVLTGTGTAFCAGVDLRDLKAAGDEIMPTDPVTTIEALRTPIIAAVNGACVTGGLEIALACDFIVAADNAFFLDTHASLGFIATWGLYERLSAAVGTRHAKEICLRGYRVTAAEAARIGLSNRVVAGEDLLTECMAIGEDIARVSPPVSRAVLDLLDGRTR